VANRLAYVCDKHIDLESLLDALPSGTPVIDSSTTRPKLKYCGIDPADEDRNHVLQLAFERDATLITSDRRMIEKSLNFGPCGSHGHRLGGVIVLPVGKTRRFTALVKLWDGAIPALGVGRPAFQRIWEDDLGVDLTLKLPTAVELCDCLWGEERERRRRRYKRK
jgi:hypothetical protein